MNNIYKQLCDILNDYENDQEHLVNNNDLALAYVSDFYDLLNQLKSKIRIFLYE